MAVSAYSPSTLSIVRDLYSVSFSDGYTVEDYWCWLLSFQKRGCLKDRPSRVGSIERCGAQGGLRAHSRDVRGFIVNLDFPLYIEDHISSSIQATASYRWWICTEKTKGIAVYKHWTVSFEGGRMITTQQLALMTAWCLVACWLTHDPHFNEGCNKGHYSVSVGSQL